jgi:hypothetical protein
MCEGLISGCPAFNAYDAKLITTNASDSLFIFNLTRHKISDRWRDRGWLGLSVKVIEN